jgi:hypothetical protein
LRISHTNKDLLCFAWQIAKGMAYLADMKVGHDWYRLAAGLRISHTNKDLLCFAWQIAKGMAYLADMKVGHGW